MFSKTNKCTLFTKANLTTAGLAILLSLFPTSLSAESSLSSEEIVVLRRIQEFWKDGDYGLAKTQIEKYLSEHQGSALDEQLQAMLGDLYFNESLYQEALACYQKVLSPVLISQVKNRKLHSLFETKQYQDVIDTLASSINSDALGDEQLLYSESLFRLFRREKNADRKIEFAEQVKKNYEPLLEGKYREYALFALAETYKSLKDYRKAADFYRSLAARYPKQKGDFLFEAATMEAYFDPVKAAATFAETAKGNYTCSPKAKVNEIVLAYHQKRYDAVIATPAEELNLLSEQQRQIADLYIGKSFCNLNQYQDAATVLRKFLNQDVKPTPYAKSALLQILDCARQIKDTNLFENAYAKYRNDFSKSEEISKIIAIHAQQAMQQHQFAVAKENLIELTEHFPNFTETQSLFLELATSFGQVEDWKNARITLLDFLRLFPNSNEQENTWNTLLAYSMKEVEAAPTVERTVKKEQLARDLTQALSANCFHNQEQRDQALIYLGKAWMEVNQFQKAAEVFEGALQEASSQKTFPIQKTAEAQTLLSQCYRELKKADDFEKHAELALSLLDDRNVQSQLHLQLFNHYLFEKMPSADAHRNAANHLFSVVELGIATPALDNLVWLANTLSTQILETGTTTENRELVVKAKRIFTLITQPQNVQEFLENHPAILESQTLSYSELLQRIGEKQTARLVLENLHYQIQKEPNLPWSSPAEVALKLSNLYTSSSENDPALVLLDQIIDTSPKSSYFHKAALLEKAKIETDQLRAQKISSDDHRWLTILSTLKDLQIDKSFASEPVHLEAAIEYATLRGELYPQQVRLERSLKLWQRVLFDFTEPANPKVASYTQAKATFPQKTKKIEAYIQFIECKAQLLEAKLAQLNEPSSNVQSQIDGAQERLKALLDQQKDPQGSSYLKKKIEEELSSI